MAFSILKLAFSAANVWIETALTNVVKQIKASSATVKGWEVVNTGNQDVYFKGWFATSGSVTIGTTAPDFSWLIPALKTRRCIIPGPGAVYPTALSVAVTSDKGTAGATAPATAVAAKVLFT